MIAQLAWRIEQRSIDARREGVGAYIFGRAIKGSDPKPAPINDRTAIVDVANTSMDEHFNALRSLFVFPTDRGASSLVRKDDSEVATLLNSWFREGTAAGNIGDLYDNRDRGHSALPAGAFPQLTRVKYGAAAIEAGIDRGIALPILFDAVTLGNASLAVAAGPNWRSLPRQALTTPGGADHLFLQYMSNQIYVYPEHQDHDAKLGDLITANTPYYLISQGSSGSDRPFLFTVASILAAFQPDVKEFLKAKGLIAPTVQWIFRRSQRGVDTDDDYFTNKAHPTVFEKTRVDLKSMIERAHDLKVDEVPPMIRLRVSEESEGTSGLDFFGPGGEILFDTPSAIARVIRSTNHDKRLVIDASGTLDPGGRPLMFHWSVLEGDGRIKVRPINQTGSVAEIIVPWQERRTVVAWPIIPSDRVDIGVFANNGKNWSAPAFISLLYPGNEKRTYRPDGQIAEVDYDPAEYRDRYVDPLLFPLKPWRDVYIYDASGRLIGWDRIRSDTTIRFARDGARVLEKDALGRPTKAERIRYETKERGDKRFEVVEVPTGTIVTYAYQGDGDRMGSGSDQM